MQRTCVKSYVHFQAALSCKHFETHVTFEIFDSSVRLQMGGESTLDSKGSKTLIALVRLFMCNEFLCVVPDH